MGNLNMIPDKLNRFKAYKGTVEASNELIGITAEVTLPSFEYLSQTVNLAGSAGEIDSPAVGQLKSVQIEIPFSNASMEALSVAAKDNEALILRGAQEFIDKETQKKVMKGRVITVYGMTKSLDMGKFVKGGFGEPKITKEVLYYEDVIDGEVVTKVDKLNGVFIVAGENLMAEIDNLL